MKRLVQITLAQLGLELRRLALSPAYRRAAMLRHAGANLVLDVGANDGTWAAQLRRCGYQGRIVSFEPVFSAFHCLLRRTARDPAWTAHRLALGDVEGGAAIHVSRNSVSSSLLPMLEAHRQCAPASAVVSEEPVRVTRLDSVIELAASERAYLKIDTQGYEKPVLVGAAGILDRVVLIECELSLIPLYDGQALFPEMLALLGARGFRPVAFERGFSDLRSGFALQVDGIFARN